MREALSVRQSDGSLQPLRGWKVPRAKEGALAGCSLVVATYQRPEEIAELLDALADLWDPPEEAVIVDATPNGTVERRIAQFAASSPARFDVVYVRAPKGLTRQRNAGIDISTGRYVFFLDDDAMPFAGYFSEMQRVFDAEPSAGGLGGAIVNQMGRPLSGRWRLRLALRLVPRGRPDMWYPCGTSTPRALMKPFSGVRAVELLPGCAFAFRREVLDQFRFSEFFAGYAQGEDTEMSLRVGRRWKLLSCGSARVVHNVAPGGRPSSYAKGRMEVRNRYFIWKRHTSGVRLPDRVRFWADLLFLIAMDGAWFLVRPWRAGTLAHGAGILSAIVECMAAPPRYEEPPARRQYRVELGQPHG
jgi:GT2 family glycosyltransferase